MYVMYVITWNLDCDLSIIIVCFYTYDVTLAFELLWIFSGYSWQLWAPLKPITFVLYKSFYTTKNFWITNTTTKSLRSLFRLFFFSPWRSQSSVTKQCLAVKFTHLALRWALCPDYRHLQKAVRLLLHLKRKTLNVVNEINNFIWS